MDTVPADADARHGDVNSFGVKAFLLLAVFSLTPVLLLADGGTLQFRKQAGPFTVTLFSAPVPLRVGEADLSVLVQDGQENILPDAEVTVRLSKADERDLVSKASSAQATNKLLHAAQFRLPSAGKWKVTIDLSREGASGSASGEISVLSEEPPLITYWIYFAVVPVGIALFVLNQWLKRKSKYKGGLPLV